MIDINTAPDEVILACTAVGEARGEGTLGMEDVICTVMNRVARPGWWGHSIREVCLAYKQYSCWNEGDPNRAIILNLDNSKSIYVDALAIASQASAGNLPDRTHGATHYRRIGTPASWWHGETPCFVEGNHEFFNNIP